MNPLGGEIGDFTRERIALALEKAARLGRLAVEGALDFIVKTALPAPDLNQPAPRFRKPKTPQ